MPYVNLGGTSTNVVPGDHYSNYSEFLRVGGRGLDTALTYSDAINQQIAHAIQHHAADIPRQELFITTKVPCCLPKLSNPYCFLPEYNGTIAQDLAKNNALLNITYTDITLLHHPCLDDEDTIKQYVQLQEAMAQGHTKAIGVSNFHKTLLAKMLNDARISIVPAVNQCNHAIGNHNSTHEPHQGGDDATVSFCQQQGIVYSAYSPLEGLSGQDIFKLPLVIEIAKIHHVSPAQIALKWLIQQNISVVTAAHTNKYIAEDIDLFGFELSLKEMEMLREI